MNTENVGFTIDPAMKRPLSNWLKALGRSAKGGNTVDKKIRIEGIRNINNKNIGGYNLVQFDQNRRISSTRGFPN